MQRRNQENPRASWRKSTRQPSTAVTSAQQIGAAGQSRRRRLVQLSSLTALILGLLAIGLYVILRPQDAKVPLIVAAVTDSSADLFVPPSPFAQEDIDLFEKWFDQSTNQNVVFQADIFDNRVEASNTDSLIDGIRIEIERAKPGGPDDDMIALCVTAQGLVHQNRPYLLVGNSRPEDESTWVSVEDLIDVIDKSLEKKDCQAVLFLDANRVGMMWDWGKLDHSFVKQCESIAKGVEDRIAMIVSCRDGERSLWDPRHGVGLFTRWIARAFAGYGGIDSDDSGKITVGEIASFLASHVFADSEARWAADQHPKLIGEKCADWEFIVTPSWTELSNDKRSAGFVQSIKEQFDLIDELWVRHGQVMEQTHSPLKSDPMNWAMLEKKLARLDQLALAGKGSDGVFKLTKRDCEDLLADFERGPAAVRSERFPELRLHDYFFKGTNSEKVDSEEFAKLQEDFDDWKKDADTTSLPTGMANEAEQETKNDKQQEAKLISLFWPWLRKQGSADKANTVLMKNGIESSSEFLETHLIRLLAADDLKHVGNQTAVIVRVHDSSRKAVFPPDIRASFWIRPRAKKLDAQRMKLIDGILGQEEEADIAAEQKAVGEKSDRLIKVGTEISDAYELRDRLLHEIPRLAETLLADPGAFSDDGTISKLLKNATETTRLLSEQLRLVEFEEEDFESRRRSIVAATAAARQDYDRLRVKINVRANQVTAIDAGDASGFRRAVAMLTGSGLNQADQRERVHARIMKLLEDDWRNVGGAKDPSQSKQPAPATIGGWHPWTYWLDRVSRSTDDLTDEKKSVRNEQSLVVQGELIRSALGKLQSEKFREAVRKTSKDAQELVIEGKNLSEVRADLANLDRDLRGELFLLGRTDEEIENATRDRFKLDLQLFLMDHAERTMREFWCEAQSRDSGESLYFAKATRKLLGMDPFVPTKTDKLDEVDLTGRRNELIQIAQDGNTLKAYTEVGDTDLDSIQAKKRIEFTIPIRKSLPQGLISVSDGDNDRKTTVATNPPKQSIEIEVPEYLSEINNSIVVDTFFRGLRRSGGLVAKALGDPDTVVFELPSYGPPTAKVIAEEMFPNIILVFDCSISMEDGQLMASAQAALRQLINPPLPPQSKVGLVMFGHRYKWATVKGNNNKPMPANAQGEYQVIEVGNSGIAVQRWMTWDARNADNPNFHIEKIADIQQLNFQHDNGGKQTHKDYLIREINKAKPFGLTPTYQAIIAAYKMRIHNSGRVIVLTDGKPNLFSPIRASNQKIQLQNDFKRQAKAAFTAAGPGSLAIVNYGRNAGLKVFKGADFVDANPANIGAVLSGLIPSEQVLWQLNNQAASKTEEFRTPVSITRWPPKDARIAIGKLVRPARDYDIEAGLGETKGKTKVQVEGGEAFQLELENDQLRHVPYADLENGGSYDPLKIYPSDAGYSVFVGNAHCDGGGTLELPLVIEKGDGREFTPRPSEVWIDIIAQDGEQEHRYAITLPEYAMEEPVPVLKCRINEWPNVKLAQIKAWMRFEKPDSEGFDLMDGQEQTPFDYVNFLVEQLDEEYDGTKYHVIVTEKYPDARDMHQLRILPSPLPDRAEIRFYPVEEKQTEAAGNRLVKRIFHYKEKPEDLKLWVKEKDEITEGAIRASGYIEVDR